MKKQAESKPAPQPAAPPPNTYRISYANHGFGQLTGEVDAPDAWTGFQAFCSQHGIGWSDKQPEIVLLGQAIS
jgi:hypothetical protein